jgi:hypothetical protein
MQEEFEASLGKGSLRPCLKNKIKTKGLQGSSSSGSVYKILGSIPSTLKKEKN